MSDVEQTLARVYQQMRAAQLEPLMALYTEDALVQSPREPPVAGAKAIRAMWQNVFERYQVELTPEVHEVTSFGDLVVVRGRAVGAFVPKAGASRVPVDSWFLQIYRRQGDGTLRFWRGANGPNAVSP